MLTYPSGEEYFPENVMAERKDARAAPLWGYNVDASLGRSPTH